VGFSAVGPAARFGPDPERTLDAPSGATRSPITLAPMGTYLQAAAAVLREAPRPLTTREVTEAALEMGLISPQGTTPEQTMSAALYTAGPGTPIAREYEPGSARARRGSVRWRYRD
jgi:hypothetical protein